MSTTSSPRFDVVIYEYATRIVESVAGLDMPLRTGGFHTAEKRFDTVLPRPNDAFGCMILASKPWKKGDKITPADEAKSDELQSQVDEEENR